MLVITRERRSLERPRGTRPAPPVDDNQTDAFDILGHELRLRIVETLGARQRANSWMAVPIAFEEIRRAVDSDDSGRFSYHLDKLLGTYVEQSDDGYVLSSAGFEVSSAILRGSCADVSVGPVEGQLDDDWPMCAADLTGVYQEGLLRIVCPEHGIVFGNTVRRLSQSVGISTLSGPSPNAMPGERSSEHATASVPSVSGPSR